MNDHTHSEIILICAKLLAKLNAPVLIQATINSFGDSLDDAGVAV